MHVFQDDSRGAGLVRVLVWSGKVSQGVTERIRGSHLPPRNEMCTSPVIKVRTIVEMAPPHSPEAHTRPANNDVGGNVEVASLSEVICARHRSHVQLLRAVTFCPLPSHDSHLTG